MTIFNKVVLTTNGSGRAEFHDEPVPLGERSPGLFLSELLASGGYQIRYSPVGFARTPHCTETPQWVFILAGRMEVGLQDGNSRSFSAGQHFYSGDTLPPGATFDPAVHGHSSRQLGEEPLITLFVRG